MLERTGRGWLEPREVRPLLDELFAHYSDFRKAMGGVPSRTKREALLKILDVHGDERIRPQEFLFIIEVCRMKVRRQIKHTFAEALFPQWTSSWAYKTFVAVVKGSYFSVAVDAVVVVLVITRLTITANPYARTPETLKLTGFIVFVFVFEMLCAVTALGFKTYRRNLRMRWVSALQVAEYILHSATP